jgi:hypothetical protein
VQVLQQLDAAQGSVEDMDEWLGIFNVKLRHMREDIESVWPLTKAFLEILLYLTAEFHQSFWSATTCCMNIL